MTSRAVIAARLSRGDDGEESRIDRDDEKASQWAVANGYQVVATSEDRNVSGGVSPFDRPGLGPWLTDPALLRKYETLIASSVDRLGRSAADLFHLREWAEQQGKSIQVISPRMAWPPAPDDMASPITFDVLAGIAEAELRLVTKRHADARAKVRENGAFFGKPPFGFEVVGERYHKKLQLRADLAPVLREMVKRALRGDTYTSIAEWLDESGVSTVHGGPWSQTSVRTVLASPALKGRYLSADGEVLHKFEGLMTAAQWRELQESLDRRPQRRGMITAETAMLTGVLFCDECKGPMYRTKSKRTKKDGTTRTWFYYRCGGADRRRSTCKNMYPLADLDAWVNRWFTEDGPFADTEIVETITVPGDDHAEAIAEVDAEIKELDLDAPNYSERHATLLSERERLKALPSQPAQVTERPSGRTVSDTWLSLSDGQRRRFLLAGQTKVYLRSDTKLRKEGAEVMYIPGDPSRLIGALRTLTDEDPPT